MQRALQFLLQHEQMWSLQSCPCRSLSPADMGQDGIPVCTAPFPKMDALTCRSHIRSIPALSRARKSPPGTLTRSSLVPLDPTIQVMAQPAVFPG